MKNESAYPSIEKMPMALLICLHADDLPLEELAPHERSYAMAEVLQTATASSLVKRGELGAQTSTIPMDGGNGFLLNVTTEQSSYEAVIAEFTTGHQVIDLIPVD